MHTMVMHVSHSCTHQSAYKRKPCMHDIVSLQKQKYEIHTKIGMTQEFTPCIPILGMNNIPVVCITYHL